MVQQKIYLAALSLLAAGTIQAQSLEKNAMVERIAEMGN